MMFLTFMNSRERVIAAINHQQPDYVPLDLGGCGQTGMNASTLYKLRKLYGLPEHPINIVEPLQMLGEVERDLLEVVKGDVVPLWNRTNLFGNHNDKLTQPYTMSDGTPVMMAEDFAYTVDDRGYTLVYPCGDRTAAPSLQMTKGGFFFDNIERSDYDEDNLTPFEDYVDSYPVKTEEDCEYWAKTIDEIYNTSDYAVFGVLGGMDIVNPVQLSAAGMDGKELKEKYGDRIVFWGGGVDTQHTLPSGTPQEVYDQVIERCKIFAPGVLLSFEW